MEGPNNRFIATHKRTKVCNGLVILFHLVGLIGFFTPSFTLFFLKLVPYHLLLMFAIIIYPHPDKNKNFWLFLLVSSVAGFLVEVIGVKTGIIFGEYSYGNTLGFKVASVPLIIGINWAMLVYSTGIFLKQFHISSPVLGSLIGAFILLCLDVLIEPVAIKYDYWAWQDMIVPFRNYIAWFVVAYFMLRLFYATEFKKSNQTAIVLLFTQIVFFIALNVYSLI